MDRWRNQRGNWKIPRYKWQQKHNGPKPMGDSKSSSKRHVDSNTILPREPRKISNKQRNLPPNAQKRGQNRSWAPGAVQTKRRKGNLSVEPQEQPIKSTVGLVNPASVKYLNGQWVFPQLRLWTLEASTCCSKARSESELATDCPQQVQRPAEKYWRISWGGRDWLWLPVGARTLTAEATGKHYYYYYSFFIFFCCCLFLLFFLFNTSLLEYNCFRILY